MTAYWATLLDREKGEHTLLAFEMESITAVQEGVDVSGALSLFPALKNLDQVKRPSGAVDLLVGIHHAPLHPTLNRHEDDVVGALRLLHSRFGTGFVLDGVHQSIRAKPIKLHPDVVNKGHAVAGKLCYLDLERKKVANQILRMRQQYNFSECEELGVGQPRRCGACSTCEKCSVRALQMTRKEQEELALIGER